MKQFEYVSREEFVPIKQALIQLINMVQDEIRDRFTFRYDFIGSSSRNMITREVNGNTGYDFDVNIRVNDPEENFSAEEIRKILINGFNKFNRYFNYDYAEDSTRVITIKVKDRVNSRLVHSCDFAVVFDCGNGRQQYIRFNKMQNSYYWEYQPKEFYQLTERIEKIKKANYWNEVRELYLYKKCTNMDPYKKSRSIFAETIDEIYHQYLVR